MFVNSIEEVSKFTKPVYTITRNYNETTVNPGAATLFFVNEEGVAITCKHVIDLISNRAAINNCYEKFKTEKAAIGKNNKYNQRLKSLEETYNYKEGVIVQLLELFVGVTSEPTLKYRWHSHPKYDLSNHLHLGFDMIGFEHKVNGRTIKVNNQPFLHVGHCVHVDVIKKFLKENNIKFYEE